WRSADSVKKSFWHSPLTTPGRPIEFTMRPLPGRYQGAADHAFATGVRALDAAMHTLRPHRSIDGGSAIVSRRLRWRCLCGDRSAHVSIAIPLIAGVPRLAVVFDRNLAASQPHQMTALVRIAALL